jgi:hypothetical protein
MRRQPLAARSVRQQLGDTAVRAHRVVVNGDRHWLIAAKVVFLHKGPVKEEGPLDELSAASRFQLSELAIAV